jgi:hypothetical protein
MMMRTTTRMKMTISRRNKPLQILIGAIVSIMALQLQHFWNPQYIQAVVTSTEERPFVYRTLLPTLSRILEGLFGGEASLWALSLFALSGLLLYLSVLELCALLEKSEEEASLVSFFCCTLFLLTLIPTPHIYDIATALFSVTATCLIIKEDYTAYLLIFPLAVLNRETAFILILVWVVLALGRMEPFKFYFLLTCQIVIYISLTAVVRTEYADNPGRDLYLELGNNLTRLTSITPETVTAYAMTLLFILLVYLAVKNWKRKPPLLLLVTSLLVILQGVMYLLFGIVGEIRVFAEVMPFILMLALWDIAIAPKKLFKPARELG